MILQSRMIPQSRPDLTQSDFAYIRDILKTGQVAEGWLVKRLERAFQRYVKTRYAAAASSGTASLHLALSALGIQSDALWHSAFNAEELKREIEVVL